MWKTRGAWLVVLGILVAVPAVAQDSWATAEAEQRTIEVRMVDKGPAEFVFEPAEVTVRQGDRIVWIQTGLMPHNVEFTSAPGAYDPSALPKSPFLTSRGQSYELVIDDRFVVGPYEYICTPHVAMGMRARIKVVPAEASATPAS